MTALKRNLEQIWEQLRGQRPSRANYLEEVAIKGLRGIADLRVALPFPVTVLAGPNGCGKSTVLFALACAYRQRGKDVRVTPASLFPVFRPRATETSAAISDQPTTSEIVFSYVANNGRLQMKWGRNKEKWNRSFFGRKRGDRGDQPERDVYLRTLTTLSNPSEIRSVLQLYKRFESQHIDASNIAFAQRILSYRYARLSLLKGKGMRTLLFAERVREKAGEAPSYSEFHMSAGERAILRLSMDISKMEDALVLIDEVEAGLHPYVQQLLMLELQRLALRNHLQVVVTTHSPAVLDTVPTEARVFLERTEDNVVRREPYRDIIQKALYGRSQNALSIFCEDEEAEAFIRGVLDHLGPKIDFLQNDIEVGRDTSKDEFLGHLETLGKFHKLGDVVFVLDGDGREVGAQMQARAMQMGQVARIVYLPGIEPPEVWAWSLLRRETARYAPDLGLTVESLAEKLKALDDLYSGAADKPAAIAKGKLSSLAAETARTAPVLMRMIGKKEADNKAGEVFEVANRLVDVIGEWRASTR